MAKNDVDPTVLEAIGKLQASIDQLGMTLMFSLKAHAMAVGAALGEGAASKAAGEAFDSSMFESMDDEPEGTEGTGA